MIVLLKSGLSDARREDVEKEEVSNDTQRVTINTPPNQQTDDFFNEVSKIVNVPQSFHYLQKTSVYV